jgi:hypothetical protein
MHNSLKIIKSLLYSYSALYVSGNLAPIIDSSDTLKLEDTTNPTTRGDWRLYVQN